MKFFGKVLFVSAIMAFVSSMTYAQSNKWREIHKVKKKETVFGIAREYGISIEELKKANPEMEAPDYQLKKGTYIFIPFPAPVTENPVIAAPPVPQVNGITNRPVRLGVMLPLHDVNGDGRRMVEYYRGVLMACDSLKKEGVSISVHTWNMAEDADVGHILADPDAAQMDVILGPLYSAQMAEMSDFVEKHDIKLVVPFSINAPQLLTNQHIFQVYQSATALNNAAISRFVSQFSDHHIVIVDCGDSTSTKGAFTSGLRRQLETDGMSYSLTSLKSTETNFMKAFSRTQSNVVVLNTGRSQELSVAFAKLDNLTMNNPSVLVTLYGYSEWLGYTSTQTEHFYKYGVYIPTPYYLNPLSPQSARFQTKYRWNFHQDMMNAAQRFAVAGFDHTMFFVKGLRKQGKSFIGEKGSVSYQALQSPLQFERMGVGGLQNRTLLLVHYTSDHRVEILNK